MLKYVQIPQADTIIVYVWANITPLLSLKTCKFYIVSEVLGQCLIQGSKVGLDPVDPARIGLWACKPGLTAA